MSILVGHRYHHTARDLDGMVVEIFPGRHRANFEADNGQLLQEVGYHELLEIVPDTPTPAPVEHVDVPDTVLEMDEQRPQVRGARRLWPPKSESQDA